MAKTFYRRIWENVLERHLQFGDVEIIDYHRGTGHCDWYGTFIYFSNLIAGVERYYFFKIYNGKISFTLIS